LGGTLRIPQEPVRLVFRQKKNAAPGGLGDAVAMKAMAQKCKTLTAFQVARDRFPWATHFAKNDIDNFPYTHLLIDDISDIENSVVGMESDMSIPKPHEWKREHGIYYGQIIPNGGNFMQGQLYVLSRSVVECSLKRQEILRCSNKRGEDQLMGCLIRTSADSLGSCPEPWWLDIGTNPRGCPCKPDKCPIGPRGPTLEQVCGPRMTPFLWI
jgi:hypothetical protein